MSGASGTVIPDALPSHNSDFECKSVGSVVSMPSLPRRPPVRGRGFGDNILGIVLFLTCRIRGVESEDSHDRTVVSLGG